ncbi:phosphoesterase [Actinoplanes sp. OR16]|uniref:phosphatase PAP2 family protein n=1 Tax=Actinoplanes sp. OR16 TaxID=946334 RepID=UPI000F6E6612|nr:phosphatase PAP2 family protein [Actinoplanes sp. OR16]BBH71298.1 phosphoesterase [Actinoplanes sp. OR16]
MTALAPKPVRTVATPPHRSLRNTASPLLVTVLAAIGVAAIYFVFIRTTLGQAVDTAVMDGGDVNHPQVTDVLERALQYTHLTLLALVCVLAAAFGVIRRRLDLSIGATFIVIASNVTAQLLKARLDRPDLDGTAMPNSFPSGHVTAAASVVFVLVLVFPRAMRGMIGLGGAAYVAVVAIATVWAEWHRPSDAVAALLIVLACGGLVVGVIRLRRGGALRPLQLPNMLVMAILAVTGAVTAAAGLLGLLAVALAERGSPGFVSGQFAFLTGSAGIVACVAGTFIIWVRQTADEPPAARSSLSTGGSQ